MTATVAVVVPVMRTGMADRFMKSLRQDTPRSVARVYAVANSGDRDTIWDWRSARALTLATRYTTMPEKLNYGCTVSAEPWVLFVGEDVVFHPGWLAAALAAAGDRFHVVGTNDLANPKVLAGEHATHMMVRRTYLNEHGAGWGEPGVFMHEGYRHWFADDEIVAAAKQRKAWVTAPGCVIEHMHPGVGKARPDAVYELGASFERQDRALFLERWALYGGRDD